MAWQFDKAVRRGMVVTVSLVNEVDGEIVDTMDLPWTRDSGQNWNTFAAMVRREVKNHIAHLNTSMPEEDVSSQFQSVPR